MNLPKSPKVRTFNWRDPEQMRKEFPMIYVNFINCRPEMVEEFRKITMFPTENIWENYEWLEQLDTWKGNLEKLVDRLIMNSLTIKSISFLYHPTIERHSRWEVMVIIEFDKIGRDKEYKFYDLEKEIRKFFGFNYVDMGKNRVYDEVLDDSLDNSECSWHWELMGVTTCKLVLNEVY